ncbi:MAG: hypothetical protein K2X52_05355 [Mycobacteriaceae bacterium]|nr:hypothetical protein [Mycobacteriaceae bacterium]
MVGSDMLTRQHLYVALTRATDENHLYLSTAEADPHRLLSPKATHPDTAVDVLTRALARDGAEVSATTAARHAADPTARLQAAADMYYDALGAAAENRQSTGVRDRLDETAEEVVPGLSTRQAWPVLRRNLAVLALSGANPRQLLLDALAKGSVDNAADPAAVLDHRIDPAGTHSAGIGVLRWLPAIPGALRHDPSWGDYLSRRERLVETLADDIRAHARGWTNATAPAWARPLIAVNPALTAEIAVFRAAVGVPATDTRLTGAHQYPVRTRAVQVLLQRHAAAGIAARSADRTRWNELLDAIDGRLRSDAYWPQLTANLAHIARATPNLRHIITTTARRAPLPDELPAAALWWRIVGAISPTTTLHTTNSRLRPPWITDLDAVFGTVLAETIIADLAWPGLVAAIGAADPDTWTPSDLLHLAAEHLADASDHDYPIAPGDYAQLITYVVDAFTHRLSAHLKTVTDIPLPDDAPPDRDDEALFPPDPENPHPAVEQHAPLDNDIDMTLPSDPHLFFEYGTGPIEGLQFDDLTATRPPRELPITIDLLTSLRQEYRTVCDELTTLNDDIAAGNGPALRAAAQDLMRMRGQIDADRPYSLAVIAVALQWDDAEATYSQTLRLIDHARAQLQTLQADPDVDELDITSARRDVDFYTSLLPDQPPAVQFRQSFDNAHAARIAAAGGQIITERDIAVARGDAERADLATRDALRERRQALRHQLEDAERDIATAFAASNTAATDILDMLLDSAQSELDLLRTASHLDVDKAPLSIPETAMANHDPWIAARLQALAAQPYQLTYTHADSTHPDTITALQTLRAAADASGRKVLWLSITEDDATTARAAELADITTTLGHQDVTKQLSSLPPNVIVIIDNPVDADPGQLAAVTGYLTHNDARVIILDPPHHQYGPSAPALRLLAHTIPWTIDLTNSASEDHRRTPTPAITIADRLGRDRLSQRWRQLLTQYDTAARAIRSTHRLHITLSWHHRAHTRNEPDHSLDTGIDD